MQIMMSSVRKKIDYFIERRDNASSETLSLVTKYPFSLNISYVIAVKEDKLVIINK